MIQTSRLSPNAYGIPRFIHDWIYSFHMPFFFILSGYFFLTEKYTFVELINRKVKTILLPYFVFSVMIDAIRYFCFTLALKVPPPIPPRNIFLYGEELGATWFLYVLFITEIVYWTLSKIVKSDKLFAILIICLSLVSYWLYKCNIHFPYKIETIGMTLLYFWFGKQMAILNCRYSWIKNYVHNFLGGSFLLFFIGVDLAIANIINPPLNIRLNILGSYLPSLLLVFVGTLLVIQMAFLLEKNNFGKRFFKYIGEYSIVLIGFSQIVLQLLKVVFDEIHVSGMLNIAGRYALLWLILLLLIQVISNYCPIIIGKEK